MDRPAFGDLLKSFWGKGTMPGLEGLGGQLKTFRRGFLLAALLLMMPVFSSAKPPYAVHGYLPTWVGGITLANLPWNDMTHVMEAFGRPNSNGTLYYPNGQRANLTSTAHANNTRAAIDQADKAGDLDTADLLTQISRELDKDLWFLQAHLQD